MTSTASQTTDKTYPTGIFTSNLSGRESFLTDHVIHGQKILPGAAYLEMARAAIALSSSLGDGQTIVLNDCVFILPMIVKGECAVETRVYPGAVGEFGVEIATAQGVHFQSNARIEERDEGDEAPLPASQSPMETVLTKEEVYADYARLGVNYGPAHRGIEVVRLGNGCAVGTLFLPGSSGQGMDLSPGMLDGVSQCAAVVYGHKEIVRVPFAIKRVRILGPLTDRCQVHLTRTDRGIDCAVVDDKGKIKLVITGFVGRELDLSPKRDEVVYYKPEWREDESAVDRSVDVTVIRDQESYPALVKAIIETAQRLMEQKVEHHVIEVHVPEEQPAWLGVVALLRTIRLEYSRIDFRLKSGEAYVKLTFAACEAGAAGDDDWADDRTILITGGMGGLGRLIAEDVARNSKGCTLILAGRREPDAETSEVIRRLEDGGTRVIHVRCDVTKRADVEALIAEYPQITGVVHGAGVVRDSFIGGKTAAMIDQVLGPKVQGLQHLDEATAGLKLDYFVVLSSIAGAIGSPGQSDYAAANGYMDAYMRHRALEVKSGRRHGKSVAINWPLWESGGMQVDEATKQNFLDVLKIKPLPTATGLRALKSILAGDEPQTLVLFGEKNGIRAMVARANGSADKVRTQPVRVERDRLAREILQEMKIRTAEHLSLRLPPDQLDDEADWAEFGFDSIILSSFVNKLNAQYGLDLMPTALFEATNLRRFSEYLADNYPQQMAAALSLTGVESPETSAPQPAQEQETIGAFARRYRKAYGARVIYRDQDVAVVGMSCRIAGARNLDEFWRVLVDEKDMITEIPRERWIWQEHPDAAKWGSFIEGVEEFDSLFFGISPAEAAYMAPEQRLMMQTVWECLENAGCGDAIRGSNTGIFVGCGASDYCSVMRDMPIEAFSSTGAVPSVGPNRISYLMDWHGPSEPIETACSSSLVAVHRAVEAIRAGHCDQAIAGGVNLLLAPEPYISFTKAGMLSDDGRCKTFSDKANGYVRGEGMGMIMLKPLKVALRDGNIIHAVIKGTAENHGGRTNSLTAPNPKSQAAVVRKALRDAGLDFSRLSYIECHGTGTALGDPVELEGLKMAAAEDGEVDAEAPLCRLGSIKSNIGHLELAAGIVGLIKVILQMRHKTIARSLHCDTLNPYLDLAGTRFSVAQAATEWIVPPGQTRAAGVSSFGFGGVNAHVVVEEFPEPAVEDDLPAEAEQRPQLMVISARNEESLINYVAQYPDFIKTLPDGATTLQRVAYTLQLGRAEMPERVAFIARSIDEWSEQLELFVRNRGKIHDRNIYRGSVTTANNLDIGDTDAGREYIRHLMSSNECGKLADLWVKGTKIDWQVLHP